MSTLRITERALTALKCQAREHGDRELMWLLGSRPQGHVVSDAVPLDVKDASSGGAVASPEEIVKGMEFMRERGLRPRGLAHSHARFAVFHSGTDKETIRRFLPAFADSNYTRPRPSSLAPRLLCMDTASLPTPEGLTQRLVLLGRLIPGTDAYERTEWSSHRFYSCDQEDPIVTGFGPDRLILEGGGLGLELGRAAGTTLTHMVADESAHRRAAIVSLVVNAKGDVFAEMLIILEAGTESFTRVEGCEIRVVGADGNETGDAGVSPVLDAKTGERRPLVARMLSKVGLISGDGRE